MKKNTNTMKCTNNLILIEIINRRLGMVYGVYKTCHVFKTVIDMYDLNKYMRVAAVSKSLRSVLLFFLVWCR